jgi:membrane protease YdiL (CAAX protease family)
MNDSSKPPIAANENSTRSAVPWNPLAAVVFIVALFFAAQLIAGVFVSVYPALQHWTTAQANSWLMNSVAAQFVYVLLAEGLTLGGTYLWLRHYHTGAGVIGLVRPRLRDAGYGILAVLPYYGLYAVLLALATRYSRIDVNQQQNVGFGGAHGPLALVLTFVSLVVLPPLVEEILMRGLLFTSLRKAMNFVWAALITSAIFASAHLPEGAGGGPLWVAAIDTFVLSLVLCWLREKTGSLWPGITLHAIKNGIAFAALFVLGVH